MSSVAKSKKKSSRSKADLFEILIAVELNRSYKLKGDRLDKDRRSLEKEVSKFSDGEKRIKEQYKRAKILLQSIIYKLDSEVISKYGEPKKIEWVGRSWQENKTLSDLYLDFDSGFSMGISLKSTRSGLGTQKNLGYKKLKKLLGLDIDEELKKMWKNIRRDLHDAGGRLRELSTESKSSIKNAKYMFPFIEKIGRKYGIPVQRLATDRSIKLFNNLGGEEKKAFLKEIFGIQPNKPMLNAFIEGNSTRLYWNKDFENLLQDRLIARKIKDRSYCILSGRKTIIRIQTSFTNGIGLSAFCERAFLL